MHAAALADWPGAAVNACAWALNRALQYAAATAVAALLVAAILSGSDAERFATVAYVTAIAAVLMLALKSLVPRVAPSERDRGPAFPAIFTFTLGVTALLILGAAVAAESGGAALAIVGCFALIGAAALVRGGAFVALAARLSHGDRLGALTRYAAAAAVAALAIAALLSTSEPETFARLAYAASVLATATVAASLLAPMRVGAYARRAYGRAAMLLHTPASAWVFGRTTEYATATGAAALLLAAVAPESYGERFATTAYVALFFAAFGVAMSRRPAAVEAHSAAVLPYAFERPRRFAAVVAALLAVGSLFASSPLGEAALVCACLYAIGAAISKRAITH